MIGGLPPRLRRACVVELELILASQLCQNSRRKKVQIGVGPFAALGSWLAPGEARGSLPSAAREARRLYCAPAGKPLSGLECTHLGLRRRL